MGSYLLQMGASALGLAWPPTILGRYRDTCGLCVHVVVVGSQAGA
jgi:hypothetical protein